MKNEKPAKARLPVFAQLCKLIPPHLVPKLAREHGIDSQARSFTPWSHVVSLLFAQLTHSIGLNDVCDTLRIHARWLGSLRGAVAPTRNTLSHANKTRDSEMMEALFWKTLSHLEGLVPGGFGIRYKGLPRRFRKAVHAVDSSTIVMVFITNNTQWAPSSVGELYQARWGIEVFFKQIKQIKQTLQLCDFLGHSKHAIRWQLWAALLLYVLMRFLGRVVDWSHSFSRLLAIVRGVVWSRIELLALLRRYGTAGGGFRMRAACETSYLPGLAP